MGSLLALLLTTTILRGWAESRSIFLGGILRMKVFGARIATFIRVEMKEAHISCQRLETKY